MRFLPLKYGLIAVFLSLPALHPYSGYGSDLPLTPEEILWIDENRDNLRFAPNPFWPPADFMDESGRHHGIVSDYIRLFEDMLGINFQMIQYTHWAQVLNGLKNREVDFVGAIQKTAEREEFLLYTDPYMEIPVTILVRRDYPHELSAEHISEMQISGVRGYSSNDHIRANWPDARLELFDDDLIALMQTSLGNSDGTVIDLMTASYLVEKYGLNNLTLGRTLDYAWEIRFAGSRDLPELHAILNKLLASVDTGQRKAIYNRWVSIDNIEARHALTGNYLWLIYLTGLVTLLGTGITLYNYELRKKVRIRTRELEKELSRKAEAENKLKRALNEREVLLTEVHHRVKNNLAIISGLLELELMNRGDDQTENILTSSIMRIRSMALIHEKFYKNTDFKSIPFHIYVDDLLTTIESKHKAGHNIRLTRKIDELHLNINLAIPAALVINELVSNAYKFAFPGEKDGIINFRLECPGDRIILEVKDNGVGLPDSFDLDDPDSLGLMLVNVLSQQLNASCRVKSGPGTRFTFTFHKNETAGSSAAIFPVAN